MKVYESSAVKLGLARYMQNSAVFYIWHMIPKFEQLERIAPALAEIPAMVLSIEGEQVVVDMILSRRKQANEFQFLTLMKGDLHHDAAWCPAKYFIEIGKTFTKVWQTYIQKHGIFPENQIWERQ